MSAPHRCALDAPQNALPRAIGLALAFGSTCAAAQDTTAETPTAATPEKPRATQLEKVDVHGQNAEPASSKFTAPLLDTAQSVTVLPRSLLTDTAANSLQDALRNVPGITFGAGEGGNPVGDRPSIRGFNSTANVYLDGMRDVGIQTRDIFDTEQVEVIKGPDSSMAGRSNGGGSINLVSKTARAETFVDLSATYGSAEQYRVAADANLKLSDGVAARFNVMNMGGGVPGRNAVRADKTGFAPTITFGLGSPSRLILSYYHLEDHGTPDFGVPIDLNTGTPISETHGVDPKNFYGLLARDFRDNQTDSLSARFEHDFDNGYTLRSQVRGNRNVNNYIVTNPDDAAGNALNGSVYRLPLARAAKDESVIGQTDLFGRFDTGSVQHDINLGFELAQERLKQHGNGNWDGMLITQPDGAAPWDNENCYLPGDPQYALRRSQHICTDLYRPNPKDPWNGTVTLNPAKTYYTTRSAALYAFDTLTITPHWKANFGLRWDDYQIKTRSPSDPTKNASDRQTLFNYQASLTFKPIEAGSIYLMTSTSQVPASLVNSDVDGVTGSKSGLNPEKTQSVELGTKWELFSRRLLLSGSVFDETHKNATVETAPGVLSQIGETHVRGVELSANGSITEAWNVTAGYSFLDGKLVKGASTDAGVGRPLIDTPRNTFSLWSTYQVSPDIVVGGGAYYRDEQVGYYGTPTRHIPDYWRFDAMAKWQVLPNLGLRLNLQNLFDKLYYDKVYYHYAVPAAGRTWMLTADVRY
ncbi:MAG: TonB-dependent receptor [Rudaea sp.]|uniref:TonB-dependent receptor n=1 Tax=unclassified Rudaea TaxID=2627037 RepID=UPI001485ABF6|nr:MULTISPECIES: TonB-dependent receptor [unclassified Rudaea]MBN8887344.1 TonB-dependent receptor [Rudaea sp.]MBR0343861.1 TonB-dependent receptor [Rudaea sp.]